MTFTPRSEFMYIDKSDEPNTSPARETLWHLYVTSFFSVALKFLRFVPLAPTAVPLSAQFSIQLLTSYPWLPQKSHLAPTSASKAVITDSSVNSNTVKPTCCPDPTVVFLPDEYEGQNMASLCCLTLGSSVVIKLI